MNAQTANHFAQLWALGYHRLCPIMPPGCPISDRSSLHKRIQAGDDARGKAPGRRWPDGNWSGFDFVAHESEEADLAEWHSWGAGVGIKTGRGLVLIDADTIHEDRAKIIMEAIERVVGPLHVRIGRYPKAGYLLRTDEDFQYTRIEFGERDAKGRLQERVEILSEGRQFVAHGIHPATQKPYRWPKGVPALADVPFVPGATLLALLQELRSLLPAASEIVKEGAPTDVDQNSLRGDIALVRKAVEATPNTSAIFPTREAYRDYGYAIKAAAGPDHEDEALEIYQDWCARWQEGDNDPDLVEADWRRMKPPFRRGANWIYEIAEQHGEPGAFNMAERWFEKIVRVEPLFPEEDRPAKRRFTLLPFDEAAQRWQTAAKPPLVKGLLDQGAMSVLYGESNAGKTFVAMDIAFHIATGQPWSERRTANLPVLYVVAEGGDGALKRAQALRLKHGDAAASALFSFLIHPINLLRADADLEPLIGTIKDFGRSFGLVVIDTLSRAMAGGDENASTDMGAMVKHLDLLRASTGAHVMAVHHSGKDRAKGARGHSLLRAATDTEIEVVDRQVVVTKQRDLDGSFARGFDLDVVTLGVDGDGDPVTSCTIRLVSRGDVAVGVATPRESDILKAVADLSGLTPDAGSGVSVADVVQYFGSNGAKNMYDKNVRFYLSALLSKGLVIRVGRGRYKLSETAIDSDLPESLPESVFE